VLSRTVAIATCTAALALSLVASVAPSSQAASTLTATRGQHYWLKNITVGTTQYNAIQGAATDGTNIYFGVCHTGTKACEDAALVKVSSLSKSLNGLNCKTSKQCRVVTGKKGVENSSGFGHLNDMVVNKAGELLVTTKNGIIKYFKTSDFSGVGTATNTRFVDMKTANGKTLPHSARICYSPKKDRYIAGTGNSGLYVYKFTRSGNDVDATWDSRWKGIPAGVPATPKKPSNFKGSFEANWNAMTCSDDYVYVIGAHTVMVGKAVGWENHVFVYDWNGNAKGDYILKDASGNPVHDEAEGIMITNGKIYVTFHGHATGMGTHNNYFAEFTAAWPK
jgi:hypothetical protein